MEVGADADACAAGAPTTARAAAESARARRLTGNKSDTDRLALRCAESEGHQLRRRYGRYRRRCARVHRPRVEPRRSRARDRGRGGAARRASRDRGAPSLHAPGDRAVGAGRAAAVPERGGGGRDDPRAARPLLEALLDVERRARSRARRALRPADDRSRPVALRRRRRGRARARPCPTRAYGSARSRWSLSWSSMRASSCRDRDGSRSCSQPSRRTATASPAGATGAYPEGTTLPT